MNVNRFFGSVTNFHRRKETAAAQAIRGRARSRVNRLSSFTRAVRTTDFTA